MNTIIVSDLHIGSRYFLQRVFEHFLENIPENHELVINGDVIDNPYVQLESTHRQAFNLIEQLSYRRKVVCVHGNHDNGYFPEGLGNVGSRRIHRIKNRLLISHGDDFDDIMPRHLAFIKVFRRFHELRVKLGAKPVHVAEYAKKWKRLYNVLRQNVKKNAVHYAKENGYAAVTCGHTHYAEDTVFNGVRYINTGAWTEFPAYYLYVTPDKMTLKRLDNSFEVRNGLASVPDGFDPDFQSNKKPSQVRDSSIHWHV